MTFYYYRQSRRQAKKRNRNAPSHKPLPTHPDFPIEKPKDKIHKKGHFPNRIWPIADEKHKGHKV